MEDLELFDRTEGVLLDEARPWRENENARIVQRRYRFPAKRDDTFIVPGSLFRSGLYLETSGASLYTLLVALYVAQSKREIHPFSKAGLTRATFDAADKELAKTYTPAAFTGALRQLRQARQDDEERYASRRISPTETHGHASVD